MNIEKNTFFLLEEIIKKNFASKYKDSALGILWSVLRPLLMMIILTIIFSSIFKGRIENYPVYILSGRAIFTFFVSSVNSSMTAIKRNSNILRSTSSLKFIYVLGGILSEFLNFIINIILLIGVMIVTYNPFYLTSVLSIFPIISLLMMIIGIGLILSVACVYYTDIIHLWGVLSMALMYACAIFYPMDIIPEPYHQYMILNPLFWIIDQFRDLVMLGNIPNLLNMLNSIILSLIILIIGIIVFKKYEKKVMIKI